MKSVGKIKVVSILPPRFWRQQIG